MNNKNRATRHDSTPPTKARWFDDNDGVVDPDVDDAGDNLLKSLPTTPVPETSLSVQAFFERLAGDDTPTS